MKKNRKISIICIAICISSLVLLNTKDISKELTVNMAGWLATEYLPTDAYETSTIAVYGGGLAGEAAGGYAGAAVGSLFGPAGAVVGYLGGKIVGRWAGML